MCPRESVEGVASAGLLSLNLSLATGLGEPQYRLAGLKYRPTKRQRGSVRGVLLLTSPAAQRLIGRFAWIMAWVGLVVGELHALARHATTDGKEDLNQPLTRAWSVPASHVLRPLLDWSDPYTVYLTYGKIWLPVFAAFTLCAFVVQQRRRPAGLEKWVWRVALTGYVIATLSVFGDYYTPWTEQSFLLLSVPGLLISLLGSTVLGIVLLRDRFRPRSTAWLLALCIPLLIGIVQVTSLGNAALPVIFAFAIAGRRIARDQPVAATGPRLRPDP